MAILALEQALRLRPLHTLIRQGLTEERKKLEYGAIPVKPFFLDVWYKGLITLFRPGLWAMGGLGFFFLAIMHWLVRMQVLPGPCLIRKKDELMLMTVGVFFMVFAGLSHKHIYRQDEAILMTPCAFRQAPSAESPQISMLDPGEKLILKDQIGDWHYVNLVNLDGGWVQRECFSLIRIQQE
jgi:hypothetical protein